MTEMKDVLHLYLECEVMNLESVMILKGVMESEFEPGRYIALLTEPGVDPKEGNNEYFFIEVYVEDVKPILSRLSDMTNDDATGIGWGSASGFVAWQKSVKAIGNKIVLNPEQFTYLLSKGYWLFDQSAFDSGLIIDRKTL